MDGGRWSWVELGAWFTNTPFRTAFLNAAGRKLLILSDYFLNISRTLNTWWKQKVSCKPWTMTSRFRYASHFATTSIKGLKNTIEWVLHWLLLHIYQKKIVKIAVLFVHVPGKTSVTQHIFRKYENTKTVELKKILCF